MGATMPAGAPRPVGAVGFDTPGTGRSNAASIGSPPSPHRMDIFDQMPKEGKNRFRARKKLIFPPLFITGIWRSESLATTLRRTERMVATDKATDGGLYTVTHGAYTPNA